MHEEIDKNPISFSLPRIPGYEMEITDDQTKLTGDTLAVDFPVAAQQPDLGVEAGRQSHELGGRAGMQAELVDDDDFPFQHSNNSAASGRRDDGRPMVIRLILVLDDGP